MTETNLIPLDIEAIKAIDLTDLSARMLDAEARKYFLLDAGIEHYKLLAWISTQFNGCNIADIGTYKGASALALSYNKTNLVTTYDVSPMHTIRKGIENVRFIADQNGPMQEDWLRCSFIMLDTVHDGIHERAVIDWLIENKWKGWLLLDDIHHFPEQNKLWQDITLPKWDVTEISHWAGSGLIKFV